MTPEELAERRGEVQLVDVRFPNEWEAGHIDWAVHIPIADLEARARELGRGRPVVVVCRTGMLSAEVANWLPEDGFRMTDHLDGGLEGWVAAGQLIVSADGRPGTLVDAEPPPDTEPDSVVLKELGERELMKLLFEVEEHFTGTTPSDDEVRAYLRELIVRYGRSSEDADQILDQLAATAPPS